MGRTLAEFEKWLERVEERKRQIRRLYIEGRSQNHIARILGISQPAVRKHLVRMGILGKKFTSEEASLEERMEGLIERLRCINPNLGPRYYSEVLFCIPTLKEMKGLTELYEKEAKKGFLGKATHMASVITELCCSLRNAYTVLREINGKG
jgi:DNA-binding transcriptional ArsR family regulator